MLSAALHLIPYALLAALSPLGFAATLAVIGSGRWKALAFATAFVIGQLLACGLLVLFGAAFVPRESHHPTFEGLLELGFGLALLWLAVRVRRRPQGANPGMNGRSQRVLERLQRVHMGTALTAGLLLGIGGPKRLVLSALAAASITAAGQSGQESTALVCFYGVLATVLVWAPVLAFVLFGERAVTQLHAVEKWLIGRRREAMFYTVLILGSILVVAGVIALL